jgi:twinkle protein
MIGEKTYADYGIDLPSGAHGEIDVVCPECTPNRKPEHRFRKDLSVNTDLGTWYCHHCDWTGGLGTRTPIASRIKVWERPRPMPQVTAPTLWQNAVAYFASRGIPESVLTEKGVAASTTYCHECGGEVGHVHFPYLVDGEHINTKHRCGKKHFRMERGAQRVLYNLDAVKDSDELIIVEGEIDALSLHTAGITNVVSVPDGAPAPNAKNYSSKFSFLADAEALFTRIRKVVIAVDNDLPGQKLAEELARRIGPEKCWRVEWDEGIKDANECLVTAGPDYLRAVIESAQEYPVEGIFNGRQLKQDLLNLYENGSDPGVGFGQVVLDRHYRVKTGYMTVVTGVPSHGKSTVLDQFLVWLADKHDWTFAIFSPEQQPLVKHQQALIEQYTGLPFSDGPVMRMSREQMIAANEWVADRFSFILPETPAVETILELARFQVFRNGVRGVVIDPWNELEHARPRHQSETEYISDALSQFRRFARNHNVHVWIVAHPTKMRRDDSNKEPVPGLWDISGSAHFRNKADIGMTVWRDLQSTDNQVQVHITKMRFSDSGQLGNVLFEYQPACKRLKELGAGQ